MMSQQCVGLVSLSDSEKEAHHLRGWDLNISNRRLGMSPAQQSIQQNSTKP